MIELDAVSYRYAEGEPALWGVSLSIAGGETRGLLGSNGCG